MTPTAGLLLVCALVQTPTIDSANTAEACRGRVLDPCGEPLAGVALALIGEPMAVLAVTAKDGSFELAADRFPPLKHLGLAARQASTTLVGALRGLSGPTGGYLVLGAPATRLRGRVLDRQGQAVAGARLWAVIDADSALLGFPHALDVYDFACPRTTSDDSGGFVLEVPAVEGLTLLATAEGFGTRRQQVPLLSTRAPDDLLVALIEVTLPWRGRAPLHGRVVKQDGSPAPGALVVLGTREVRAEEDGSFVADLRDQFHHEDTLCAALPGFQPAIVQDPAVELAALGTPDAPVVLTLGGPALSITGRVFDHLGNPCADWSVELSDGTQICPWRRPSRLAEHLSSGRREGQPVTTRVDGSFRIEGLLRRTYVLDAWDPWTRSLESPISIRSGPIQAGTSGVEVRLEPGPCIERFTGRLIDLDGTPRVGVAVKLMLDLPMVWPGMDGAVSLEGRQTDAEGRFDLGRVPARRAFLQVGLRLPLSASGPERGWDFLLPSRPNLRLDWERAEPPPDTLEILDADGAELPIYTFLAGRVRSREVRVEMHGVRSHLLAVSPMARSLRLHRSGDVLEEMPLTVLAGEVTRLVLD